MVMRKIKVGDEIVVTTGADKGKRGTVSKMLVKEKKGKSRLMAIVDGIKLIRKHVKPNPQAGIQGGIVEKESAIDASNIALYNPSDKRVSRVGIKVLEDGKKVRYFKSNGENVDGGEGK